MNLHDELKHKVPPLRFAPVGITEFLEVSDADGAEFRLPGRGRPDYVAIARVCGYVAGYYFLKTFFGSRFNVPLENQ
jgi:hypothetical protein